jgi:hypothetical protein
MEAEEVTPDDGERLCRAAQDSTAATVEALLASGWDVSTADEVMRQRSVGDFERRWLESNGYEQNGVTALQLACFNNEEETVRCLLDAGAAIEARNVVSEPLSVKRYYASCGV